MAGWAKLPTALLATMRTRPKSKPQPRFRAGSSIFPAEVWVAMGRGLGLTEREVEIVSAVFDDRTELGIAAELGISPHTVHTHIERLHHKLAVVDRVTMVLRVVQEFLRLTGAPGSRFTPICGKRAAGLCPLWADGFVGAQTFRKRRLKRA